jgi:hypothetical protein
MLHIQKKRARAYCRSFCSNRAEHDCCHVRHCGDTFFNAREIVYFFLFSRRIRSGIASKHVIALKCLSFALVPYALSMIIGRIFYSLMKIRFAMVAGVVTTFSVVDVFFADIFKIKPCRIVIISEWLQAAQL